MRCSTSSGHSRIPPIRIPDGSVDPARDLERLDLEFILADLSMAERRLERLKTSGRHGTPAEREAAEREEVVLRRIHDGLEAGRRSATWVSTRTRRRRSAASAS